MRRVPRAAQVLKRRLHRHRYDTVGVHPPIEDRDTPHLRKKYQEWREIRRVGGDALRGRGETSMFGVYTTDPRARGKMNARGPARTARVVLGRPRLPCASAAPSLGVGLPPGAASQRCCDPGGRGLGALLVSVLVTNPSRHAAREVTAPRLPGFPVQRRTGGDDRSGCRDADYSPRSAEPSRASGTTPPKTEPPPSPPLLSSTRPSRATASTCTPDSPSPRTTTSAESASAATACARHFPSRASASSPTAASRTA